MAGRAAIADVAVPVADAAAHPAAPTAAPGVAYKVVLAGDTGTGKTMQFETFPGRRYAHILDPAAHSTLRLAEGEYENFFPGPGDLDLYPRTVIVGSSRKSDAKSSKAGPQTYLRWATKFNQLLADGFFNTVDSFLLDSATVLGHHCLVRHQYLGEALGRKDERVDYRMAGECMIDALLAVCSLPCHVLITLHTRNVEVKVGETKTGETTHKLTLPGGATLQLPRFVSAMWYTAVTQGKEGSIYKAQTRPLPRWPHVRTPRDWSGLELWHDLTIPPGADPRDHGIGGLISGRR